MWIHFTHSIKSNAHTMGSPIRNSWGGGVMAEMEKKIPARGKIKKKNLQKFQTEKKIHAEYQF